MEASAVFGNKIRKKKKKNLSFNRLFCQVALETKKKAKHPNVKGTSYIPGLWEGVWCRRCRARWAPPDFGGLLPAGTQSRAKPPKLLMNPTTSLNTDKEHRGGLSV